MYIRGQFVRPFVRPILHGLGAAASFLMSPSDIYQLALSAGFPASTAVKMTAIALRESRGNPAAFNGVAPDESYGLWQINMLGDLGTRRMALFGLTSKEQLFDPATNARAAYLTWGGNDANIGIAWGGSPSDAALYQQFLPMAVAAAGGDIPADQVPEAPGVASAFLASLQAGDPVIIGATLLVGLGLAVFFQSD
jgi:hypothetical protein